jgi:uncharacterized membrane protein YraQ (UPF0718 family)
MVTALKRYRVFLVLMLINLVLLVVRPDIGMKSISSSAESIGNIMIIIPPIFVLLGLLDIWVPRETIIKLMGEGSGIRGVVLAFLLGSFAAGPLYASFPIAMVLMRKGTKFSNVIVFIGAWSTTKIPLLLFEAHSMGWRFMLSRLLIDIVGIVAIAVLTERMTSEKQKELIYENAQALN